MTTRTPLDPEAWRLHQLLEAGYPAKLAEKIAAKTEIDLHQAVELVRRGWTPEQAAEVLL